MFRRYFGGSSGSGINVHTEHSYTGYGHQDLFHARHRNEVFQIMAGMVRDAMYDIRDMRNRDDAIVNARALSVERSAVDNETGLNDEWPGMAGYRAALRALYTTNPARHWGDSDPEQLARVKVGTMKQWAQVNCVPATMCVVLIGPNQHDAVRMVRDARLNELPPWPATSWSYNRSDDVPVLTDIRRITTDRSGATMHHVCMLWPTETFSTRDAFALEVLEGILKDRIDAALREGNLVHPGGIYHSDVVWDCSSSHGVMLVEFATRGDRAHCEYLIERMLDVISDIVSGPSSELEEDVEDATFFLAHLFLEHYRFSPGALSDRILMSLANGDEDLSRFSSYYDDIRRVTHRMLRAVAAKYLHRDRFVCSVVRPAL